MPKMTPKSSAKGKNTLFNYFSPTSSSPNNENSRNAPNLSGTPKITRERPLPMDSPGDENIPPMKRRRIIVSESEDSDSEKLVIDTDKSSDSSQTSGKNPPPLSLTPAVIRKKLLDIPETIEATPEKVVKQDTLPAESSTWAHDSFDFLKLKNLKDANGIKANDPKYNPKTLYVPREFLNAQTPAMYQWWILKKDHFDCVLFYKVGKFYELYHMDAVVGVNYLGLSFMKGSFAHSGFPEVAYSRFSSKLVELGYKVARVEQTETPDMMAERCKGKKTTKFDKVVKREICQITNKATRVNNTQDVELARALPQYLLALCESGAGDHVSVGACFIDTSVGCFYLAQFHDDERRVKLSTLLAEHPPACILVTKNSINQESLTLFKNNVNNVPVEYLNYPDEFYEPHKTVQVLQKEGYFKDNDTGKMAWPPLLHTMLCEDLEMPREDYELALSALGAVHFYLKRCYLDIQLFTMDKFEKYVPSKDLNSIKNSYMIIDANTMTHLHMLGPKGTLQATLNRCSTKFGQRLMHQWICRPLNDAREILRRQEAVTCFLKHPEFLERLKKLFITLPDLERMVARIHSLGSKQMELRHPDSRAIIYGEKVFTKNNIIMFIKVLTGFKNVLCMFDETGGCQESLIKENTFMEPVGKYPDYRSAIHYFDEAFNHEEAKKEGKIKPKPGVVEDYDMTMRNLEKVKQRASDYLQTQRQYFGCQINYFGNDKKRYQLEVPEHLCASKITKQYFLEGSKKGSKPCKRYHTDVTKQILADTLRAEKENTLVVRGLNRKIFAKFSSYYEMWKQAIDCIAELDCVMALADYTRDQSVKMCRPNIASKPAKPFIKVKNCVHPFIPDIDSFVPNDTQMGTPDHPALLMLTGPNMGGKSTLMRQVALVTIMAQIGCYVPASSLKFTLVDRIFTRLGAKDDIMAGLSTFRVELDEAVSIVQNSTRDSLVLLDELGRGTSTYDGTAIASAYINCLSALDCRTMFSTHYYKVVDRFKGHPSIQLAHMTCLVEPNEEDPVQETVTFMYKLAGGACPKSYGFNAAKLAGVPRSIIDRANVISIRMWTGENNRDVVVKMIDDDPAPDDCRQLIQMLTELSF